MNTNLGTLRIQRFHRLATLAAALFLTLPLAACGFGENPQKAETPPGPVERWLLQRRGALLDGDLRLRGAARAG